MLQRIWEGTCAEMKRMTKAKLAAIFGIIAVLALLSTGTLAYFTTQAEVENKITTGAVSLEIRQQGADLVAIMPGDTIDYKTTVANNGDEPIYVRVKLKKEVENNNLDAEECLDIKINTAFWEEQKDEKTGEVYYYYKSALNGEEVAEPLFEKVEFVGSAIDNQYIGKSFVLHVAAYGVQSANNADDALSAFGWPEEADAKQ